ncbi:DUF4062 domain-containing protein [Microbacterium sp. SYP-A9085]|uniref:DUF4062 domain-containing protein n=1 Tax=Microbacterium sp. SYP-A9085 TaxID=2664454 RepID=UPI00129B5E0D|nr:DUF4062 domain-containing protein [Microbacterium sp. SYP-A9085]MRH29974.1 DUF4062 domain-containing protein [Microbacterium sp. SYP-A9085]
MTGASPVIRTPDRRIRVFVSSTLRELADERRAARAAIERMRLAPVMFELGARPHPPRSLYRAYLDQSDVFVGIYADSYGWVAPGEEISGLEDEYDLVPDGMPKLIYVRRSERREDRLVRLIARIQSDDTAAYLPFDDASQLEEQIAADLAALLAERFEQSMQAADAEPAATSPLLSRVPVPYTTTIGRDEDIAAVRAHLAATGNRTVSLIGPGGVGKSRLAIEVARSAHDLFTDGVYFVPLEGVLEAELLLPTIAYALGVRDNGEASLEERISRALADRHVLIVLDNFEQIVDAAPVLVRLYTVAPTAVFLVTSRIVLRIRGEQVYEVRALPVPSEESGTLERARRSPACALFVDRARAADPDFALTEDNAADVARICRTLEGLPLAIELAAAKARMLTPQGIAQRLGQSLPLLTAAVRDLPERHRTMRATIEWSVSLLSDADRDLLETLGVFARRFTLDAVEALGAGRPWEGRAIEGIAALVDGSLVAQTDVAGRSVYSLLAIVREYAVGRLRERGVVDAMRMAYADHYTALVHRVAPGLRGSAQAEAVAELGLELPNLRGAIRHLVYTDRLDDAADFAWSLLIYWWIVGFLAEVRVWMLELLEKQKPITPHTRAVAWFFALWGQMWQNPSQEAVAGLAECVRLFTESGDEEAAAMAEAARATARVQLPDPDLEAAESELRSAYERLHGLGNGWAQAITQVSLGRLAWLRGALDDARAHFDRAIELAAAGGDLFTLSVAGNQTGRLLLLGGDADAAHAVFCRTLLDSVRLHFDEGIAYGLEGLSGVAALRDDPAQAGALAAAAATIRHRIGMFDADAFTVHFALLDRMRAQHPDELAAAEQRGAELTLAEAVALALPEADHEVAAAALGRW